MKKKSIQGPFEETVDALHEATGLRVPKRSAEEIVIDVGIDFDSSYPYRQGNGEYESSPILVGSVDCKGIPMVKSELALKRVRRKKGQKAQKKKMATVVCLHKKLRVVVMDGERALLYCIVKGVVLILNFLHLRQKLWTAGHARYGE